MSTWKDIKNQLIKAREILAKVYFLMPNEDLSIHQVTEGFFTAFDAIDGVLKGVDEHLLTKDEYHKKYSYGGTVDEIDDHTSVWGGAGPDCIPVPG